MKWLPALILLLTPAAALACGTTELGALTITAPWARATAGAGRPAAFYVEIRNDGLTDDALTGISTPVAGMAMLHQAVIADGRASMAHVEAVPLPAGQTVRLEPGGYHAMLTGLDAALQPGGQFPVTLDLRQAGKVTVSATVMGMGAGAADCPGPP